MTVEEIIKKERQIKNTNSEYGLQACKDLITFQVENNGADLYQLLKQYAERANSDKMKTNATAYTVFRQKPKDKELLKKDAEAHDMTVSEYLKWLIEKERREQERGD